MTEGNTGNIDQIQTAYGQHSAGILNRLRDRYDEIAKSKPPTEGSYFDRLDDTQKQAAIREYRLKLANEARDEAKQQYTEAVREYRERVEQRKTQAEAALSVAADRNMGDALLEVFGDEERALYQEIQQAPPTEVLERQTHDVNIDAVVPDVSPDVI